MNKLLNWSLIFTAALAASGCVTRPAEIVVPVEGGEAIVADEDVPEAARERLETLAAGHPILMFEREDRGHFMAYEAEWLNGDVEQEATVMEDGTVLETERELLPEEMATLPPGVAARAEELRREGYNVAVARREIILYDIDATPYDEPVSEDGAIEELLRPDGRLATGP